MYRLLQFNLRFDNRTPEKLLSLIGRTKPDVITLQEGLDKVGSHAGPAIGRLSLPRYVSRATS